MHSRTQMTGNEQPPWLTLYCLPHAGGGAAGYVRWRRSVPAGVEVVPMELPGHGSRLVERPVDQMGPLVDQLLTRIRADDRRGVALLGHSFGALLAFETARRLAALGAPPEALLLCGRNAPTTPSPVVVPHHLPDEAFLAAVQRLGGIPDQLRDQPALLRAYLPALRADLRMADGYRRGDAPPLAVPLLVFGGSEDTLTHRAGLAGWERETTSSFELTMLAGDHFFVRTDAFAGVLRTRLERLMTSARP
ncbi:thioesterase II family protein [Micromonospora sp. WMMD723]|uniref:thioesterase II family protein n=1 Tax=unclassified Micromonospora TaxID=2617518 RepID=UPI003B935CBC